MHRHPLPTILFWVAFVIYMVHTPSVTTVRVNFLKYSISMHDLFCLIWNTLQMQLTLIADKLIYDAIATVYLFVINLLSLKKGETICLL